MNSNRPFSSIGSATGSPFLTSTSAQAKPLYNPPAEVGGSSIGGFRPASTLSNQFSIGSNTGTQNNSTMLQSAPSAWQTGLKPVGSFSSIGSGVPSFSTGPSFQTSSGFGTGGTGFGYQNPSTSQSASTYSFGGNTNNSFSNFGAPSFSSVNQGGTSSLKFEAVKDRNDNSRLASFLAMPGYLETEKSTEELRAEDYTLRKAGKIQFPKRVDGFRYTQSGPSFPPPSFGNTIKSSTIKPGANVFTGTNSSNSYIKISFPSTFNTSWRNTAI